MPYIYAAFVIIILIAIYLFIKFKENKKDKNVLKKESKHAIRNIAISSILMALAAILKISGIMIGTDMRLAFYAVPLILAGLVCGVDYGILAALGADLVYSAVSGYAFNVTYTIGAILWGLLGGILKYQQNKKNKLNLFLVFIGVLIASLLETHINLLSNLILYGKGTTFVLMLYKYLIIIIKLPIITFLVILINERVVKKIFADKK